MIRYLLCSCLLILISHQGNGQNAEWLLKSSIAVENLGQISLDNRETIFYSDKEGNVFKIDSKGVISSSYSPRIQARLSVLEAFSTLTLFLFSVDLQQVVLLDTNLNPLTAHSLQQEDIGIVSAATLGNNNVFWLFDEVDLSLKLYDYKRSLVLQKQPLSLILGHDEIEVLEIQERQNLIYLNIKNQGIHVFDNQGNLIKILKVYFEQSMSIHKDYLYYIKDEYIQRLNVFTEEEALFIKPEAAGHNILVGPNKVVFYSSHSLLIYDLPDGFVK